MPGWRGEVLGQGTGKPVRERTSATKVEKVLLNWEAGGGLLADGGKRRTVVVMGG